MLAWWFCAEKGERRRALGAGLGLLGGEVMVAGGCDGVSMD